MSFGQAIVSFFQNYVNFSGRARRSEFWFACLFRAIVAVGLGVLMVVAVLVRSGVFIVIVGILMGLCELAFVLPSLALEVRRVHDIGDHWYDILLFTVPLADIIFFIYFNVVDSQGDNRYGPSPKYPGQPQYGQPPYGQPPYGQSPYGQPQYNNAPSNMQ